MANSALSQTSNVADGSVTNAKLAAGALFTAATEQATTSGTAIDFTGIPSGTQMIVIMFDGVSLNSANNLYVRLGTSGGIEATGYMNARGRIDAAATVSMSATTDGFVSNGGATAGTTYYGTVTLLLEDATNNVWTATGALYADDSTDLITLIAGRKATAAVLDRVRITSANPDTFDAGAVSIMYR